MAKQAPTGRWHRFRVIFRRCRIAVLLLLLACVGAVLYLNSVGLPGFIKRPLLQKLHERGLDLHFTRLRWRPIQGLVAEDVFFGRTNDAASPELTSKQAQLRLDYRALLKRQFLVQSIELHQGRLSYPIAESNGPPRELFAENIQADLELLTNDVWELKNFQAEFGGARFQVMGTLTNASAMRDWKIFQGKPSQPWALQNRLRRVADALEQIHFTAPPELKLDVRGDARDLDKTFVRLFIGAPGADTPWGSTEDMRCFVLLAPPRSNQLAHAEVNLRAAKASARWAETARLALVVHMTASDQDPTLVHADLDLSADAPQSRSNRADSIHITAQWVHSLTNAVPLSGQGSIEVTNVFSSWGDAERVGLQGSIRPNTNVIAANASWAWWTNLAPYLLDLRCNASRVHSSRLDLEEVECASQWSAPELRVTNLSARLYDGKLNASAKLDVATRDTRFKVQSDFDPKKVSQLLTPKAQEWLTNYTWNNAPQVIAEGAMVLPSSVWTNRHPDWRHELRPTLWLNGEFHVIDGAFRGVRAQTADSHFTYSNLCWYLPDLVATRPEGRLNLFQVSDERTQNFYFRAHSTIDPRAARSLLETNGQRVFDFVSITEPPTVDVEVWGKWHDREHIGGRGHVTATNFTVRGEPVQVFRTDFNYTNLVLNLIAPWLQRGDTQEVSAGTVRIVFPERKIYVTNGFSTTDPMEAAHAIGPHAERALAPYHFLRPPVVRAEGIIPMRDESDADLHFDVDGGPLQWWKLEVPRITGKINWTGQELELLDLKSEFYLGKASGNAKFNFNKESRSALYRFEVVAEDANLHVLAKDLSGGKTNKLEGLLTVRLGVTNADTANWRSWQGAGRVDLHDGLIWDIPIFGVFSPALDTVMPGLGSSRARQGSATFVITNGVLASDDLKIETLMARLRYWGTVDLGGDVNARMEAELLRNTWVVGPVLSFVLWPVSKTFEYHITGSIHQPRSEPVYIPRIFFFPLHPVQTIKDMRPEDNGINGPPVSTNAPPLFQQNAR
jgi:hypothetical protein